MNNLVGNSPLSDSEFSVFLLSTLSYPQHNFFSVIKINPSCNFFPHKLIDGFLLSFGALDSCSRVKNNGELKKRGRSELLICQMLVLSN